MHLKSFVKRNLVEGSLVVAGIVLLVVQFGMTRYLLRDGGIDHTAIVGAPLDDVYIHCRFAENLLSGHGYSFNPDHLLSADTSPLWVVLIAIGGFATAHFEVVAVGLSLVFFLLLAPAVFRICRFTFMLPVSWSVVAAATTLLSSRLLWAASSGMEITLACFLVLLCVDEHLKQRQCRGPMRLREGIFLAIGIAARPEIALLAFLLFFDWILVAVTLKYGLRSILVAVLTFLLFALPVFLIPYLERGSFIYHSSVVQGARISLLPNFGYLFFVIKVFVSNLAMLVLIAFLAPFVLLKHKDIIVLMLFGFGLPIVLAFVAPQFRHHGRYFFEVLPILIILGTMVSSKIFSHNSRKKYTTILQSAFITLSLIGACRGMLLTAESITNINDQHLAASVWINERLTSNDRLAVDDVGAIGYFTKRSLIDLTGLMSPDLYPLQQDQHLVWLKARALGANMYIIYTRLNASFYQYAKDSLELVKEFRIRPPLVSSADTVMSVFKVKEFSNAAR